MTTTTKKKPKPYTPRRYSKRALALLVQLQKILDLAKEMNRVADEASRVDFATFLEITKNADRPGGDEWEADEYMRCLDAVPFVLCGITPTIDSFLPHYAVPKG